MAIDAVRAWIEVARMRQASDLHLLANHVPWLREQGSLQPFDQLGLCSSRNLEDFLAYCSPAASRNQGSFSLSLAGQRLRITAYLVRGLQAVAIRFLPAQVPTVEQLALPARLIEFARNTTGLLLLVGPTGSGKSTTAAALLQHVIGNQRVRWITLEDPIEYVFRPVHAQILQREVGLDVSSFRTGVREALRQDPDGIFLGEQRDVATMEACLTAADSGHFVLSTLHGARTAQAIARFIASFPAAQQGRVRAQLADVLCGVVSQRLVRAGKGRRALFEVLVNTPAVAHLIRTDALHQMESLLQTGGRHGMQRMAEV